MITRRRRTSICRNRDTSSMHSRRRIIHRSRSRTRSMCGRTVTVRSTTRGMCRGRSSDVDRRVIRIRSRGRISSSSRNVIITSMISRCRRMRSIIVSSRVRRLSSSSSRSNSSRRRIIVSSSSISSRRIGSRARSRTRIRNPSRTRRVRVHRRSRSSKIRRVMRSSRHMCSIRSWVLNIRSIRSIRHTSIRHNRSCSNRRACVLIVLVFATVVVYMRIAPLVFAPSVVPARDVRLAVA